MQYELIQKNPKTYVLIFETGDELAAGLKKFAAEAKLAGSSFKAIGALSAVNLPGLIGKPRNTRHASISTSRWNCCR